jgi:hypothetical protein
MTVLRRSIFTYPRAASSQFFPQRDGDLGGESKCRRSVEVMTPFRKFHKVNPARGGQMSVAARIALIFSSVNTPLSRREGR